MQQAGRDGGSELGGHWVLVIGASGGVRALAVQIAQKYGAPLTTVASTRKLEMVRSQGADDANDLDAHAKLIADGLLTPAAQVTAPLSDAPRCARRSPTLTFAQNPAHAGVLSLLVHQRIAGEDRARRRRLEPLVDPRLESRRDNPAHDLAMKGYPSPRGRGAMRTPQSPNCPRPPDCYLWRPWPSPLAVMVSR